MHLFQIYLLEKVLPLPRPLEFFGAVFTESCPHGSSTKAVHDAAETKNFLTAFFQMFDFGQKTKKRQRGVRADGHKFFIPELIFEGSVVFDVPDIAAQYSTFKLPRMSSRFCAIPRYVVPRPLFAQNCDFAGLP